MWSDWLVVCDCGSSLSALWCPLSMPTILLGFLLPWMCGISSWQQLVAIWCSCRRRWMHILFLCHLMVWLWCHLFGGCFSFKHYVPQLQLATREIEIWSLFKVTMNSIQNQHSGTSLMVQWPRVCIANTGSQGMIPGQETRSHLPQLRVHMCN